MNGLWWREIPRGETRIPGKVVAEPPLRGGYVPPPPVMVLLDDLKRLKDWARD